MIYISKLMKQMNHLLFVYMKLWKIFFLFWKKKQQQTHTHTKNTKQKKQQQTTAFALYFYGWLAYDCHLENS